MPKTKFQSVIFTIIMAFAMVYPMICYNISLNIGGMTNEVFLLAFHELLIMWPVAFVLEMFVVERLAKKLAFTFINPAKVTQPIVITLSISAMIVCLMCPMMSLVATILFKSAGTEFFAVWVETTIKNFPMAFFWQMFFAGPIVRLVFRTIFKKQLATLNNSEMAQK